jgi:AraC family transcriptional regulator
MDVEIAEMPELRVAGVHHVGPYMQISQAFGRLSEIARSAGLFRHPGAAMIAVYHDDPDVTPQAELRSDAGIVVPERIPLPEGLGEQRLAAGRYARAEHVGPYEELGEAWDRFKREGLSAGGHRGGAGPSYEIYRNDPTKVAKQDLRTDLYIPIV